MAADGTGAWVASVQSGVHASDGSFIWLVLLFDCGYEWSFFEWDRFGCLQ